MLALNFQKQVCRLIVFFAFDGVDSLVVKLLNRAFDIVGLIGRTASQNHGRQQRAGEPKPFVTRCCNAFCHRARQKSVQSEIYSSVHIRVIPTCEAGLIYHGWRGFTEKRAGKTDPLDTFSSVAASGGGQHQFWLVNILNRIHITPCRGIGKERAHNGVVHGVAGTKALEMPGDRRTGKVKVAHAVENLVPDELVLIAQALFVKNLVAADHHRVIEAATTCQTHFAQLIDLFGKAEGPRARDFALECAVHQSDALVLFSDCVAVEIDLEADRETITGGERCLPSVIGYRNALEDLNDAAGLVLCHDTRTFDEEHEGCRAAIHDRHFRAVNLDIDIVDAATGERGEQMFNGGNLDPVVSAQSGAKCGLDHILDAGFNLCIVSGFVSAAEYNACIFGGGLENDGHGVSRVQACATTTDLTLERVLQKFAVCEIVGHMIFFFRSGA